MSTKNNKVCTMSFAQVRFHQKIEYIWHWVVGLSHFDQETV